MSALKVTELGEYLKEQRHHAKLSLRQLAEQAGVSNPYLSQVERGLRKPSAEVLQQIAKGLRISAEALYVRAGFLEDRADRVEVEAAVLTDPFLTERQRRVLLDIYQTFRDENERDDDVPPEQSAVRVARRAAGDAAGKPAVEKAAATKATAKKATATKVGTASTTAKKTAAKKAAAKKTAAKTTAKKAGTTKATAKKTTATKGVADRLQPAGPQVAAGTTSDTPEEATE